MSLAPNPLASPVASPSESSPPTTAGPRLHWSWKVGYTAFMLILVFYYWREYGPTNFLYFCDVALFLGLAAVWTEKAKYASMAAVGILLPQVLWQIDFLGSLVGTPVTGMTGYMFDSGISWFARALSFFHFWLPLFLLFLVRRLGYDRRALYSWSVLAWGLILVSFLFLPAPGDPLDFVNQPHNVNYVYGLDPDEPQQWMAPWAWVGCLLVGLPLGIYRPTHWLLTWQDRWGRTEASQRSRPTAWTGCYLALNLKRNS